MQDAENFFDSLIYDCRATQIAMISNPTHSPSVDKPQAAGCGMICDVKSVHAIYISAIKLGSYDHLGAGTGKHMTMVVPMCGWGRGGGIPLIIRPQHRKIYEQRQQ